MFPFPFSYIAPLAEESSFALKIVVPDGADQTVQLLTQRVGSGQPNTTIDWGEGAGIESLTITNPSNTFSPGAYTIKLNIGTNSGPVDRFRIDSGEALFTEVVRWGVIPWKSLANAFENCVNLTTLGTSDFIGSSLSGGTDLNSCFMNCTSLTTIDARTWDLSTGAQLDKFAKECESLTDIYLPTAIPRRGNWTEAFRQVGTAVTAGCNFHLGSLDFTGTTSSYSMTNLFSFSRINPSSNFTNWNWGSNAVKTTDASYMFRDVALTGVDSTLDVSGWSTFNALSCTGMFYGINRRVDIAAASGITIEEYSLNISNLNTSSCTAVAGMFANTGANDNLGLKAITGLSTLPASSTVTTMETFMAYQNKLALNASDNFSDAFMNSIAPTSLYFAFRRLGSTIPIPADYGAAPNLASLDLSNLTALTGIFREGRYSSNFDFSNVTFPTAQVKADTFFFNTYFSNADSSLNFSSAMNIGGPNAMLNSFKFCVVKELTFSNNVDFSGCETFREAFRQMKGSEDADAATISINLPTNMSFAGVNTAANNSFSLAFNNTKGTGSTGTTTSAWNALDSCNTNNLLRRLKATLDTPGSDSDIVLNNCKYSGPSTVVSSEYDDLIANGWTFGTLASESPYILYTAPFQAGDDITPVINISGGTFSSTDVVVDSSTGLINTNIAGNATIKYSLPDLCYNEQILDILPLPLSSIPNYDTMQFNGTDQYIDLGTPEALNLTQNMSISAWINTNTIASGTRVIICDCNTPTNQSQFCLEINRTAGKISALANGQEVAVTGSTTLSTDTWYHVALTRSGSTGNWNYVIYLNGVVDGSATTSDNPSSQQGVAIGRFGKDSSGYFSGKIDEVAVLNIALSGAQIQGIYDATEVVDGVPQTANLFTGGLDTSLVYWNRMGDS